MDNIAENKDNLTDSLDERLTSIVPSNRQLFYEDLEFIGFIHFTVNTFTGREWGDGTEDESIFNPTELDASSWVSSLKSAGIKGIILTCKHHDGFCLWPSKYTNHSVAKSPYKDGKGDIMKELSEACKKEKIAFGIYLSPWDRNSELYGLGKPYDDYFVNQLEELLTNYGKIFCVWFDGACGEGPNGKKQVYDWDRYYEVIRRLQPEAVISVCGPDVRWCGNEAGDTREAEWSVVPKRCADTERIKDNSQKSDDESFRLRKITASDSDLGSRKILLDEHELIWYPAEVDVSIRPGWFYHEDEDDKVKSLDELKDIYIKSVGGNANLLLNVPPNKMGLIAMEDKIRLKELGEFIDSAFKNNLSHKAKITLENTSEIAGFEKENVVFDNEKYFRTDISEKKASLIFEFDEPVDIGYVVLKEQLRESQRIEEALVIAFAQDKSVIKEVKTKTVGHKRILCLDAGKVKRVAVNIIDSRRYITLKFVGIYEKAFKKN